LLRCGLCGRRLESCWANNRAAYRCRHGHTSSARRDPDRPKNLYVREDRLLTYLPTLHIILTRTDSAEENAAAPSTSADVINHLRTRKIALIYDPQTRALQADTEPTAKVTVGHTG
jgi:site-specific DNA recombinase